jgi:outer membrane protein TolC
MRRTAIGLVFSAIALGRVAYAEPEPVAAPAVRSEATARRYTLTECLTRAENNYPVIQQARAKVRQSEARLFEARTAPFSEFKSTGGFALAPTLRGTNVYSPNSDVTLSREMDFAWQLNIEGVIPLWTFGKIDNLVDAAKAGLDVDKHEVYKARNEVLLSVRRAFYGLQLANDALLLVQDARSQIEKYAKKLEVEVEEEDGDEVQLMKLRMHLADLVARESEAVRQARTAQAGLAFLIGAKGQVEIEDTPLAPLEHRLAPLATYLTAARLHRPEINMARAGVLAREAQLGLEQSRYFPDVGVGLSASWSAAPEVDDQQNPFVRDQANYKRFGVALVMRWDLDFLPQYARVNQAAAQLEAQRATEQYALGGVGVEVTMAYEDALDAQRRLDAYAQATQYARRWLILVQQGIDIGTYESKDIIDPAKEYAIKRFSQMQATFDYNVALAKLAQATGWKHLTEKPSASP